MAFTIGAEPIPVVLDADGVARIGGTRVTVDAVVAAFVEGATPEEIAHQYPSLRLADVYSVIAYYLRRRDDVEAYLRARDEQAAAVRAQNESQFDPQGVRARLMARQTG